jgi:hypothetical protein
MSDIPKPQGSLTPAYGRDYETAEQFLKDWNDNKDFTLHNHVTQTYINKADAERYGGDHFQIRFNKIQDVSVLERDADGNWSVFVDEEVLDDRVLFMVTEEEGGDEYLSSSRDGCFRSRVATQADITCDGLASMLDQEAENVNFHDFVGVHQNLAKLLLDEVDEDDATEIMRQISNHGGLHKMQ